MDEKNREELQQDVDRLENTEVEDLSEGDLESIAGGEQADCSSGWCCTSSAADAVAD